MKKTEFGLLPIPVNKIKERTNTQQVAARITESENEVRVVTSINNELSEKLKDYVYWARTTQRDVLAQAIEYFLKDKDIKSRPESEKSKEKTGRKRKQN